MGKKKLPRKMQELVEDLVKSNKELVEKLESRGTALTKGEIEAIAQRVASCITEDMAHEKDPPKKERIKQLAYDIGISLVASGIWHLLLYAGATVLFLEGPEGRDQPTPLEMRYARIRRMLESGLTANERADLEELKYRFLLFSYWHYYSEIVLPDLRRPGPHEEFWGVAFVNMLVAELTDESFDKILPP